MRKAWCDICGREIANPEDTGIGTLKMNSSYMDDTITEPIHKSLEVCKCCLVYIDTAIQTYQQTIRNATLKEEF